MGWTVDSLTYDNRKKITVSNTNIDGDLADFPLLVKLVADTDIGGISNADGFDIRFTQDDGETLLYYERESFAIASGDATGQFWVRTNLLTASTTDIYIYYRAIDTADGADIANTWESNYKAVHHFNEASGNIIDATSNDCDGAETGTNPTYNQTGKISTTSGMVFNGGYFNLGDHAALNITDDITIEMIIYPTSVSARRNPYNKAYGGEGTITQETDGDLVFFCGNNGGDSGDGSSYEWVRTTTPMTVSNWYYKAVRRDESGNEMKWFTQGAPDGTDSSYTLTTVAGSNSVLIGDGYVSAWLGTMDEIRVSAFKRPDEYFKFVYSNIWSADNELTFSADELSDTTKIYTKESKAVLPTDTDDLATAFITSEITAVASDDSSYATVTSAGVYSIGQFKNTSSLTQTGASFLATWNGNAEQDPSASPVYLQLYNWTTDTWITFDENDSASTGSDFMLTGSAIGTDVHDYVSGSGWVSWRVYQQAL